MATTFYSTDDDLIKIRPNILQLGVASWEETHLEAFDLINRTLIARWYKSAAPKYGVDWRLDEFNPDNVDVSQLRRLSCYKVLELVYEHLMKDGSDADGYERHSKHFATKYSQELKEILAIGISYDWDEDSEIASEEKYQTEPRRLKRV